MEPHVGAAEVLGDDGAAAEALQRPRHRVGRGHHDEPAGGAVLHHAVAEAEVERLACAGLGERDGRLGFLALLVGDVPDAEGELVEDREEHARQAQPLDGAVARLGLDILEIEDLEGLGEVVVAVVLGGVAGDEDGAQRRAGGRDVGTELAPLADGHPLAVPPLAVAEAPGEALPVGREGEDEAARAAGTLPSPDKDVAAHLADDGALERGIGAGHHRSLLREVERRPAVPPDRDPSARPVGVLGLCQRGARKDQQQEEHEAQRRPMDDGHRLGSPGFWGGGGGRERGDRAGASRVRRTGGGRPSRGRSDAGRRSLRSLRGVHVRSIRSRALRCGRPHGRVEVAGTQVSRSDWERAARSS